MPKKLRAKNLAIAAAIVATTTIPRIDVQASTCPDLKIIYARGSGAAKDIDEGYLNFKSTIEEKLKSTTLKYEFVDLDYPAVGVGVDKLGTTLGAVAGAGESYEFGESVNKGVRQLIRETATGACADTKFVIGGYSQGAMVISKALGYLNADKIIYAATFGDPKIYLPEGEGRNPDACFGRNLSPYRMYVPDCYAYKGLLGAYVPYQPEDFDDKLGTWCNKGDIFCSSHLSISDHTSYVADGLYENTARVIFNKIAEHFHIERRSLSPHDTAFLIDSTGSMSSWIKDYKDEALRLATQTLESGGRVALFDYRDLKDPYTPVKHCEFEDCTLDVFQEKLASIRTSGGGDEPESLLSAAMYAMQSLNWQYGATKSLVVLTDANYLSPDRDGTTEADVIKLSREIDPVNIYVITQPGYVSDYVDLTDATGGRVVSDFNKLNELTDFIIERFDSLPVVEESDAPRPETPELTITDALQIEPGTVKITFETDGAKTVVALNDILLGTVTENTITITGIDEGKENLLALIPLGDDVRGETVMLDLATVGGKGGDIKPEVDSDPIIVIENTPDENQTTSVPLTINMVVVPKTPNTGRR